MKLSDLLKEEILDGYEVEGRSICSKCLLFFKEDGGMFEMCPMSRINISNSVPNRCPPYLAYEEMYRC